MVTTKPTPRAHAWSRLAGFLAVVALVALVAALAATHARQTYEQLVQPSWAAPPWLFGPVWTVLYLALAFSGWFYWRTDGETSGFAAYGIGLLLNLFWTPLFFAGGSAGLALLDVLALDVVVVITAVLFGRRSKIAAVLLVPYLCWLLYVTALNTAIVALN